MRARARRAREEGSGNDANSAIDHDLPQVIDAIGLLGLPSRTASAFPTRLHLMRFFRGIFCRLANHRRQDFLEHPLSTDKKIAPQDRIHHGVSKIMPFRL